MADNWVFFAFLLLAVNLYAPVITIQNFLSCGMDSSGETEEGEVPVNKYPWIGILYYAFNDMEEERATAMAVLIRKQHALVPSFDVSNIPKTSLRTNARVVFGEDWGWNKKGKPGQPVDKYSLHPEYKIRTLNTMAIVKFYDETGVGVWPICLPALASHRHDHPLFSVIIQDVKAMTKIVRKMTAVVKPACTEFYRKNQLMYKMMQPTLYMCAVAEAERAACVWEGGSALASRDPWGRWRLIGFGVRGPGCAAPAQYLDVFQYLHWIEQSVSAEEYVMAYKTAPNQLILRQGMEDYDIPPEIDEPVLESEYDKSWLLQKEKARNHTFRKHNQMGNCFDTSVPTEAIYKENTEIRCDAMKAVQGRYRIMITQIVNVVCVSVTTLGVHHASPPFLWIEHICDLEEKTKCHIYRNTTSALDIAFLFSFKMRLKVEFIGQQVKLEQRDKAVNLSSPYEARAYLPPYMAMENSPMHTNATAGKTPAATPAPAGAAPPPAEAAPPPPPPPPPPPASPRRRRVGAAPPRLVHLPLKW